MASDSGFGSYNGIPGDKIFFIPGTRYGIMSEFKKLEECSCYSAISESFEK
jgi:hypothetical protein